MPTTDVALRGLKGLWWEPHEYRGWPAFLASAGYNLLLVCYTAWPELSIRWRHGLSSAARSTLRALAHEATAAGIELGLALNPCIGTQSWAPATAAIRFHPGLTADWFAAYWRSRRAGQELAADPALRYDADADLADLLESCRAAAACGVRVLVLCLDDVEPPVGADPAWLGRAQARLVAAVRSELDRLVPAPRLLVVPTYYWTAGLRAHPGFAAELARALPASVDVFWTGPRVRSQAIDAAQARTAAGLLGRPPVVWLNYASNDAFRFALQLPPAPPPAPDLGPAIAGLLVNPMRQAGLSRLHVQVMGAYLRDPPHFAYRPALAAAAGALAGPAGPLLERLLVAWSGLPDVRRLAERAASDQLRRRVHRCVAELDSFLPGLLPSLPVDARAELERGVERVRLLAAALDVRQGGTSTEHADFLRRLADVDDELACDARAVLMAG
jgi:hypothetical protein